MKKNFAKLLIAAMMVNVHFSANSLGTPIYRAFPDYENFSKTMILTL